MPTPETRNPKCHPNFRAAAVLLSVDEYMAKVSTQPRNPEPGTRNPRPETRDLKLGSPEPEARNPKPGNRNPKPETRDPKPGTRNPEPETWNTEYMARFCLRLCGLTNLGGGGLFFVAKLTNFNVNVNQHT